jgi:hypothetical protein
MQYKQRGTLPLMQTPNHERRNVFCSKYTQIKTYYTGQESTKLYTYITDLNRTLDSQCRRITFEIITSL